MITNSLRRRPTDPLNLIALVVIVAVLYFTREICIPFVLALLLSHVLSPLVSRVQRLRIPRVAAVFVVVGLMLGVLGLGGWLVGGQILGLADKLPQYQTNVHKKFKSFQTDPGGLMDRLNATLESYTREVESIGSDAQVSEVAAALAATSPATKPVAAVKVQTSNFDMIERVTRGVLGPLTTCSVILLITLLLLFRPADVRDRALRLLAGGDGRLHEATRTLDDAGARVSQYLLNQLMVNAAFGICVGEGLFLIGVPYYLLWGCLAAVLRFVPYFGAPLAAVAPLFLAFAAAPGWTAVVLTLALFLALEIVISTFVEPWLYGAHARISPLAIIGSAIFWSWLWGPIGLLLSTPLTVCLVVIGPHVPRLWFLSVLLGDEPVLSPPERFYQRLLAGDQAQAWELAEEKLGASSMQALYEEMLLPALVLTEQTRHQGGLRPEQSEFIFASVRDLLEELGLRPAAPVAAAPAVSEEEDAEDVRRAVVGAERAVGGAVEATKRVVLRPKVLCIPAQDEVDELAGIMLGQLLGWQGVDVEVLSYKALAGERMDAVGTQEAGLVCISALPPQGILPARYLCKRLRARHPGLKLVAGLWGETRSGQTGVAAMPADAVVTSLAEAVARIVALANVEAFRTDAGRPAGERAAGGAELKTDLVKSVSEFSPTS